jgi:hypothetical protein
MIKPEDLRIGDLVRTNRDCAFPKGTMCVVTDIRPEKVYKDKVGVVGLETEPRQYPKMCGVFITYEVLRWYRTRELITRYVRIRIGAVKSKTSRKIK